MNKPDKKPNHKKWLIIAAVIAVVAVCGCALQDVLYFYLSGFGYVQANYDVSVTEVPCDIEISVDLTATYLDNNNSGAIPLGHHEATNLSYRDMGYTKYLLDETFNNPHGFKKVDGENYRLNFIWQGSANPFKYTVYMPFDVTEYSDELFSEKTVSGDGPNSTVPVDNITVTVDGVEYTPVWYETTHVPQDYVHYYRLGLFEDPTALRTLLDSGATTATVSITKLYKAEYTYPSLSRMFEPRVMPEATNLGEAVKADFECDMLSAHNIQEEGKFKHTEVPYYIENGELQIVFGGVITNYTKQETFVITKFEPILETNLQISDEDWWPLIHAANFHSEMPRWITVEQMAIGLQDQRSAVQSKLPFRWTKLDCEYLTWGFKYAAKVDDLPVGVDDVQVELKGVRIYLDDGMVYEFYDNNNYTSYRDE